ncbi:MAG: hypothetical protein HY565_05555 [Candidatus Kerfeldbacteria bacterium]|nr:hypothetical protein [Candidatus Kerfeldbacteria bacterium]
MNTLIQRIALTLVVGLTVVVALPVQADVVEPLSYAENCIVITNLNDYPAYTFVISSIGPYGNGRVFENSVVQDECFSSGDLGADEATLQALPNDTTAATLTSQPFDISHTSSLSDTGKIDYYTVTLSDDELILTLTDSERTESVYGSEIYEPLYSNDFSNLLPGLMIIGVLIFIGIVGLVAIIILSIYLYRRRAHKPHP